MNQHVGSGGTLNSLVNLGSDCSNSQGMTVLHTVTVTPSSRKNWLLGLNKAAESSDSDAVLYCA